MNLATASLIRNEAKADDKEGEKKEGGGITLQLHGTGGTALIPFLKQTRDETRDAARI